VLGVQELFQKNFEDAKKHFHSAAESRSGNDATRLKGELGALLCQWLADSQNRGALDGPLSELAKRFQALIADQSDELATCDCPQCNEPHTVRANDNGRRVVCPRCTRFFTVEKAAPLERTDSETADDEDQPPPLLNEDDVLVRDVLIWHMVSLLYVWMTQPENQALTDEEVDALRHRAKLVRDIDEQSGHAALIEGLILYYFGFDDEEQRKAGFDLITQSIEKGGVNLPEVHSLADGERRREERRAQAAKQLIRYIRSYLTNSQVSVEVRKKVHSALQAYARRFEKEVGAVEIVEFDIDNAPTARDMGTRLEGLDARVAAFLRDNPEVTDEDRQKINEKKEEMDEAGNDLRDGARRFEETEGDVLSVVGQMLLKEEEP
ncbi:hypothetical protein ACFL5Q_03120, partial [Planctomycetota bacterium]